MILIDFYQLKAKTIIKLLNNFYRKILIYLNRIFKLTYYFNKLNNKKIFEVCVYVSVPIEKKTNKD